jgi:hypothetical protein
VFLAGRVGNELILAVLLTVVLTGLGTLAYGVPIPAARLPALIATLIIAAAALCCCAFAFTTLIRKEDSAVAVAMGVMLTLFFISGNFFKVDNSAMRQIAGVFPVKHLNNAFLTAFNPHIAGSGILWPDLLVITLWGLGLSRPPSGCSAGPLPPASPPACPGGRGREAHGAGCR